MAVLSLLLLSSVLYSTTTLVSGESLYEPNSYELIDGGEYFINVNYCDFTVKDTFTMTGRCWCWYDPNSGLEDCSVPGPTLIVYNGATISLTVTNNLVGSPTCDDCNNEFRDPDVINLHTHGLYISGEEDHVLLKIEPGESYTYEYNIHEDHYPGTMWYHAHHHGSSAYQLSSGLFGALIVKNTEENNGYLDDNLLNMKSNTLIMHHMIMADSDSDCDCSNIRGTTGTITYGTHRIHSACNLWCATEDFQTEESGAQYDMAQSESNNDDAWTDYFLVNSQINPSIEDVQVGEWRKLQIINGQSDLYIHMDFDEDYDCEYYLLGRDGIWFKDGHRDLCDSPTNCHLFVSPGGRADLAVKCDTAGSYTFHTSTEFVDTGIAQIATGRDNVELFTINVVDDNSGNDYVTELPASYPPYPYHLRSLLDEDNELVSEYDVITQCGCSGYDDFDDTCEFDFGRNRDENGNQFFAVNGEIFDGEKPQFYLNLNKIYEFSVSASTHPHHMHVRPFQLMEDVVDGYFGEKGDLFDTLGAPNRDDFMIRFINLDYTGTVVLHCHFLQHEDEGMMAFMEVVDSDVILDANACDNNVLA